MSLNIVADVYRAEKENKHGECPLGFVFAVILFPILTSGTLILFDLLLTAGTISTLINVLAIFVGFLIASLVPYFEIAAMALSQFKEVVQNNDVPWEIENRRKLFKIIFPSIILSIFSSLAGLAILIILTFLDGKTTEGFIFYLIKALNFSVYFFLLSNFMNIYNLVRRTSALVMPILEDKTK